MLFFKKKEAPKRTLEEMMRSPNEDETINEDIEDSVLEEEVKKDDCDKDKVKNNEAENVELNALFCFGWKEDKTEKWMIKCAKVWYAIMSFFWFVLGALSFAPVIFISNKSNVLFKDKKMSFIFAIALYCILIVLLIILLSTKKRTASV